MLGPDSTASRPNGKAARRSGECVAGLVNAAYRGMAEQVASHDLNPLEFGLLRAFLGEEEWTTTGPAQVLPVKAPHVSRVVTKLVDRGLICRRRPSNDRRVVFLTLTDVGKALTLELHRRVQAYDARLPEGVSKDEMAALVSVTSKVMTNYAVLAQSTAS